MSTKIEKLDAARSGADASSAIDYDTFPNAMPASRDVAPRLGRAYAVGTSGQDEVYECMKALGYQMGKAEAERVWNATALIIKDRMPKDGRAYDIGFVRFFPALDGTFDSADGEFDPARNRLYVAAAPSDEIRNALADGSPTRIGGSGANDVRITNVTWGDNTESNTVKSGEPFLITGTGLTVGVGDEHAEFELPEGGTVSVALSAPEGDTGLAQRLVGRLAEPVAACEGATLWVWTHGFDPTAALRKVPSNKLTVLAGETPPVDPPVATSCEADGMEGEPVRLNGGSVVVYGENLARATKLRFRYSEGGDPFYEANVDEATDTSASCEELGYTGSVQGGSGYVSVVAPGGESNNLACRFSV